MNADNAALPNFRDRLPSLILLTVVLVLAGDFAMNPSVVNDPDVWWHLRAGQWIVEHRAWPQVDLFSQVGYGKPWIAYGWLFEVLIYGLFTRFGLTGIVGFTVAMTLAIVAAFVLHLRQFVASDKQAAGYAALGVLVFAALCYPRPWLFTLLLFLIEYSLLLKVRRTGRTRLLWCLPPLFALWANLHIQFIYGLFLLGFDTFEPWLEPLLRRDWAKLRLPVQRWLVLAASLLATLATPYHFKLYRAVAEIAGQAGVYQYIQELRPLSFTDLSPWALLMLTLWAVFRLGWRRLDQPGLLLLLLVGVLLAFRSSRDMWFLAIIAATVLVQATLTSAEVAPPPHPARVWPGYVLAVLLAGGILYGRGIQTGLNNAALAANVAANYPAAAAQVIAERGYAGPLFNHFDWGGYLIWHLPQLPVSMDGRTNLYGPAGLARHTAVWRGKPEWKEDAELNAAGVVLASPTQPLCELLRFDQRFELVYEDSVAAVFVHRQQPLAKR